MNPTLERLLTALVRRQRGVAVDASPDADGEAREAALREAGDAEDYLGWLDRFGITLARPGDKRRLLEGLLEECELREARVRSQLEVARREAAASAGVGPPARAVARLERELAELDEISGRIFGVVRPPLIRGAERPERVQCRFYRSCRGWLSPREAWSYGSMCESCRESAAARASGSDDERTWLDELVSV